MKIKITNPWITIIWFFLSALLFIVGLKLQEDSFIVPGAILMAALHIFYFPILSIVVIRGKNPNAKYIVNLLGTYSIGAFVFSVVMKLNHLPGASVFIILGAFVFTFIFLPSWFFLNWPINDKWGRLLNLLLIVFMGSFMLFWLFKLQFWPGATAMGDFTKFTFYYVFIPALTLIFIFSRYSIKFKLSDGLIIVFVFAYLFSNIQTREIVMRGVSRDTEFQNQEEKKLDQFEKKNSFLYESLLSSNETDSTYLKQKEKAQRLKIKSDSVFNYIQKLKTKIVSLVEDIPEKVADTLNFADIDQKEQMDLVTFQMIGNNPMDPKKGPFTALELKLILTNFKSEAINYAPEEVQNQLFSNSPIDLSPAEYEDGFKEEWEVHKFYHEPLGKVYTTLSMLQNDVRYTEQLVLSEIFNKANFSRKDNLGAQLAEIAAKYENAKKEKQIALLEKDKEVSAVQMQAKDAEISDREKTITYFVIALFLFIFMLIFVIRSNLLRKATNKKLEEQNGIIVQQKKEVEMQKHLVEEKQQEVMDSINYARRIQFTLLAHENFLRNYLPNHFVFFNPKDIVSGDFYWASFVKNKDNEFGKFYLAVCDSTGHGVPGAFMSLLNISFLNEAINEKGIQQPNHVFNYVRQKLIDNISKEGQKDGFDGVLLCIDTQTNAISYAAANNAPVLVTNNSEHQELPKDRMPVGIGEKNDSFTLFDLQVAAADTLYLYTDGYADQFGGEKGKKFKYKQLNDLIFSNRTLDLTDQQKILKQRFEEWKGNLEQVDDVCVIGIKF
jgi:serine phosphatase RsbU (regulator of sigma subunit)